MRHIRAERDGALDSARAPQHRNGPAADQMLLLTFYARCVQASTVFLTDSLVTEQR